MQPVGGGLWEEVENGLSLLHQLQRRCSRAEPFQHPGSIEGSQKPPGTPRAGRPEWLHGGMRRGKVQLEQQHSICSALYIYILIIHVHPLRVCHTHSVYTIKPFSRPLLPQPLPPPPPSLHTQCTDALPSIDCEMYMHAVIQALSSLSPSSLFCTHIHTCTHTSMRESPATHSRILRPFLSTIRAAFSEAKRDVKSKRATSSSPLERGEGREGGRGEREGGREGGREGKRKGVREEGRERGRDR